MDLTENVLSYYREVVEPMRATVIKTRRDSTAGLGAAAEQAMNELIAGFTPHRRPERPTLTYLGWVLAGGAPDSTTPARVAIASEFAHSGGLIHDDIVDGSPQRNWQPTTWARYADRHANQRWAAAFGRNVALWLGNVLLWWANDLFAEALLEVPTPAAETAKTTWTRGFTELWASQHLDLVHAADIATTGAVGAGASARAVAQLKGQYVAALPLVLGAALAGGAPQLLTALRDYGQPLGEAYVYRNDLEGTFGDPQVLDSLPEDLRERRLSVLLTTAYDRATPEQAQLLRRAGSPDLTDHEAQTIRTILVQTGARTDTEHRAHDLATQALAALDQDVIAAWARPLLATAAHTAMTTHTYA